MRFIGSMIKYVIYLCIVIIAASAALFWFDTGSWLVRPLAVRAGNYFLAPMTLEINSVEGSVREGYSLGGLRLISGDKDLLSLANASVSPDWDLVFSGMDGLPFIKALNVRGISSDLDSVMTVVNHFASPEDDDSDDAESEDENSAPLALKPFALAIHDVKFATPYANLSLDRITLNRDGNFVLNAEILSRDNSLPLKADALMNFAPLEIASSDLRIGRKGTGKFVGVIDPLKADLYLSALSLEELMKFAPDLGVKASGRIDGRVSAQNVSGNIKASGVVSMPRADVMGVPLNFRLPFSWDGVSVFALNNAALKTKAASVKLNAQTDINSLSVKADGQAQNISLNEIGRMFAPEAGLDGEGGWVNFDVDTVLSGDILSRTKAVVNAGMPQITAAGVRILRELSARVNLTPGSIPRIAANGEIFGGKLFARGEAAQTPDGTFKPGAVVSVVNMDIPTLLKAFPAAAKNVADPSGKITARAVISDTLDVNAKLTSDKLSANGVTLNSLYALMNYSYSKGTAELQELSMRLINGSLFAKGNADINRGTFAFKANADNFEPRIIPALKDLAGKYNLTASGSGNYTDVNSINVDADLHARGAGYAGTPIGNIDLPVNIAKGLVKIPNAIISLPKGKVNLNGNINLSTSRFDFAADAVNVEPRYIKALKDVAGTYNLKAAASGNYTDINSIKSEARLTARNAGYSGVTLGNVDLPVNFANNVITIPGARASLPGGSIALKGNVNIKNASDPLLDVTASTQGINLAEVMTKYGIQDKNIPVSGKLWGNVSVKGSLSRAGVNAALRASKVKAGDYADIPSAALDVSGNTQKVSIRNIEGTVNGASIKGSGNMLVNQKNIMKSKLDFSARFSRLNLKELLTKYIGSAPATGILRGDVRVGGTIEQPSLYAKLNSPVIYGSTEIEDIAVRLRSPEANHYVVNAGARINDFRPEAEIDLKNNGGVWVYKVDTKPLDVDKALTAQKPEMAGTAKGLLTVSVKGSTKPNSDINVKASSQNIRLLDKVDVQNIVLPAVYKPSVNKVEVANASAKISGGLVKSGFEYDISEASWKGNVKAQHLNFGDLANKFLPEGELVGSVDAEVNMNGRNGVMATSFATGKFTTTPGYFHKMAILDRITPTKKVTFEKISGTFFWNGSDLFLNPGTGARAAADEPLYRYVTVNGSLGVPGKGLKLLCDGRFDLKILDQFLGAMKGVFQYMTGSLGRDVLKDAAGRVLGVKRRDLQNVSFTLANSWENLRLEDLKITKPIEDFLPIDILNRDQEAQKDDTQFKLKLKIPTGPGAKSAEEDSTSEQLKEQLIDNLFNWGL